MCIRDRPIPAQDQMICIIYNVLSVISVTSKSSSVLTINIGEVLETKTSPKINMANLRITINRMIHSRNFVPYCILDYFALTAATSSGVTADDSLPKLDLT